MTTLGTGLLPKETTHQNGDQKQYMTLALTKSRTHHPGSMSMSTLRIIFRDKSLILISGVILESLLHHEVAVPHRC